MKVSILPLAVALAVAGATATAHAQAASSAPAASAPAAVTSLKQPVPPPPEDDPKVQELLAAMDKTSTWGHPDLFGEFAGMRLFSNGDYAGALKYFKFGARYADKLSQLSIGLMYANGNGVAKDPATACAWLALASERKFPTFVATRDRICKALTPAQHDAAVATLDTLLPEYGDAVAKRRMERALAQAKMETTGSRLGFDGGIDTVGTGAACGGKTIGGAPMAGCGSINFWSPWRWDPKKYFAARDATWRGTVTVGALQDVTPAHGAAGKAAPAKAASQPAPASSAGH